jgi:hypothetical protein
MRFSAQSAIVTHWFHSLRIISAMPLMTLQAGPPSQQMRRAMDRTITLTGEQQIISAATMFIGLVIGRLEQIRHGATFPQVVGINAKQRIRGTLERIMRSAYTAVQHLITKDGGGLATILAITLILLSVTSILKSEWRAHRLLSVRCGASSSSCTPIGVPLFGTGFRQLISCEIEQAKGPWSACDRAVSPGRGPDIGDVEATWAVNLGTSATQRCLRWTQSL